MDEIIKNSTENPRGEKWNDVAFVSLIRIIVSFFFPIF
jgi:hypothetical protein